jgi:hypothetical protein
MPAEYQLEPLFIGLFGVSERSRKTLEVLFSMHAKGRYRLADNAAPHAAIVDMDGPDAGKLWSDYRSCHPDLPSIVISFRGDSHPDAVLLKKPVTPQSLLDALGRLLQEASTPRRKNIGDPLLPGPVRSATAAFDKTIEDGGFCGDAGDIDPNDFKVWYRIYFDPDGYFRDACRQAMRMALQTGQIQSLTLGDFLLPVVFLPEEGGQVITQASDARLRFYSRVTLDCIASAIVPLEMLPPDLAQSTRIPFDRFLWNVTLWTSRGRLPEGTPIDVPLRLKCWPNFTRLTETPYAMSIAALWCRQPYSLLRICQVLDVPQRYVFGFYSAVNSAGLVEWQSDHLESSTPLSNECQGEQGRENTKRQSHGTWRGLLRRILSHLLHN